MAGYSEIANKNLRTGAGGRETKFSHNIKIVFTHFNKHRAASNSNSLLKLKMLNTLFIHEIFANFVIQKKSRN